MIYWYMYNSHASTHRSVLKYTYITLIYVLCSNITAEVFKLFHRIFFLHFYGSKIIEDVIHTYLNIIMVYRLTIIY